MTAPRLRKIAALAAETAGSLLLVLVLFWLFLTFLYALFPSGTPLKELMGNSADRIPARDATGRRPEAELKALQRDVRCRRGNSVAWGSARDGMPLYNHDAVQTFDRSGATITFAPADYLLVGSNSMVLVSRIDETLDEGPRTYRVQVEGELRGTLSASKGVKMELSAAGHLARLVPGAARFRIAPSGDNGASLVVYAGEARVQGSDGVIRVPSYHGITLRRGVPAGPAVPLPEAPILKDEKLLYKYRLLPPRVRFAWGGAAGEYRFQLSREPRFLKPLVDCRLSAPELSDGTLEPGSYFWRVCGVRDGMEGRFSRTGRFELRQLLKPPELKVEFPQGSVAAGEFALAGSAEPGMRVFVNGAEVAATQAGVFLHRLQLRPGVNLVRVEAVDPAGNASYASRVIHASEQ